MGGLGLQNTWTSHIAYLSVLSLLGLSVYTSSIPVPGACMAKIFGYSVIGPLLCSIENINKRSSGAPASYYFCQNEILYSERLNGFYMVKIFLYFTDICSLYSLLFGTLPQSATRPLKTCSMAVRAIPLSVCHQFGRAAIYSANSCR